MNKRKQRKVKDEQKERADERTNGRKSIYILSERKKYRVHVLLYYDLP